MIFRHVVGNRILDCAFCLMSKAVLRRVDGVIRLVHESIQRQATQRDTRNSKKLRELITFVKNGLRKTKTVALRQVACSCHQKKDQLGKTFHKCISQYFKQLMTLGFGLAASRSCPGVCDPTTSERSASRSRCVFVSPAVDRC